MKTLLFVLTVTMMVAAGCASDHGANGLNGSAGSLGPTGGGMETGVGPASPK